MSAAHTNTARKWQAVAELVLGVPRTATGHLLPAVGGFLRSGSLWPPAATRHEHVPIAGPSWSSAFPDWLSAAGRPLSAAGCSGADA
jgi:hypothetical protein